MARVVTRLAAVAVLTLAALVLSAASAAAFTQSQVDAAVAVAKTQNPGSPCAGREDIRWGNPALAADVERVTGATFVEGWHPVGTCTVYLWPRQGATVADLCTIAAHELAHAAGVPHSHEDGWMHARRGEHLAPVCAAAFPPAPPEPTRWRCWLTDRQGSEWCTNVTDREWRAMKRAAAKKRALRASAARRAGRR